MEPPFLVLGWEERPIRKEPDLETLELSELRGRVSGPALKTSAV
jgi:hypothetical protein